MATQAPSLTGQTPPPPIQDDDQYTDAQLKDGTTIRFKGQLNPDQVKQKVSEYRARQSAPVPTGSAATDFANSGGSYLMQQPGENYEQFQQRAIKAGQNTTPEQIAAEHESNKAKVPGTIGAALTAGAVSPVGLASAISAPAATIGAIGGGAIGEPVGRSIVRGLGGGETAQNWGGLGGGLAGSVGGGMLGEPVQEGIGRLLHTREGKITPAIPTLPAALGQSIPKVLDTVFPEPELEKIGRLQTQARRIDPYETARAQKAQGIPVGKPSPFGPPSEEGVPGGLPRSSDRLVLLPSEARASNVLQDLATQRASQRGMQYAAGMRPVGNNIPRSATRISTLESPGPRESINYGRLGEAGISPEAVNRPGVAYKVGPSGVGYLGKDIDASLKPNEAVVRIMPDGKMQVVNSNGLADTEVLRRYGDKIKNARSSR